MPSDLTPCRIDLFLREYFQPDQDIRFECHDIFEHQCRTTPSTMARGICVMAKIPMNRMNELTTPPVSAGYASASSSDVIT